MNVMIFYKFFINVSGQYAFVINRNKFRTAYKLLRIEKVDFFLIFIIMLISEASQQPFKVLKKVKNGVFKPMTSALALHFLPHRERIATLNLLLEKKNT